MLDLLGMSHAPLRIDDVAVSPPHALPLYVPGIHEVVDDPLSRPLGDSDGGRNVTQTGVGIALNREENLCMAREEVPPVVFFRT